MISVEEAQNIIGSLSPDWGQREVKLELAMGEVLAQDIYADRDFPPFDRVTMDGIAVSHEAFEQGRREFRVQETQLAGVPAVVLINKQSAIEIMTGAILSHGCDLVIRYEDLEFFEQDTEKWVRINVASADRWKNVHKQASDQKTGACLINKGVVITAAEVAIMATVGCSEVTVVRKPKVAIVSTGDELVDVASNPLPHQIRKSNSVAMQASLNQLSFPCDLFHLLDDKEELFQKIDEILTSYDLILLSGGVSKGKADYLPEILTALGVEKLFHRIAQRPGKPFWFGAQPEGPQVFAFPGNPISTYMCFRVYFLPWLLSNLGRETVRRSARLMEDFAFKPDLGYFLQVKSRINDLGEIQVWPTTGNGSGDLANLAQSDAFIYLSADKSLFEAGQLYEYYSFEISSFA